MADEEAWGLDDNHLEDAPSLLPVTSLFIKKEGLSEFPDKAIVNLNELLSNLPEEAVNSYGLFLKGPRTFNNQFKEKGITYQRYHYKILSLSSCLQRISLYNAILQEEDPFEMLSKNSQIAPIIDEVSKEYIYAVDEQSFERASLIRVLDGKNESDNYWENLKHAFLTKVNENLQKDLRKLDSITQAMISIISEPNKINNYSENLEILEIPESLKSILHLLSTKAVREVKVRYRVREPNMEFQDIVSLHKDIEEWKLSDNTQIFRELLPILRSVTNKIVKTDEVGIHNILGSLITHIYLSLGENPNGSEEEL
jgi:hypothetical protein